MGWDRTTVQLEPFTSNEPELHQYQYVRIPLQIWTPLVTYDSKKKNKDAQRVDGPLGSYNTVTIHQNSSRERIVSIEVLLSQINAIITRPQTCRLDDALKRSVRRTALAVSQ